MMKRYLPLTLLAVFLLSQIEIYGQGDTLTLSMDNAVEYALSNSTKIKNAYLSIADAEQQINENRAIGLPKINGSIGFQHYLEVPVQPLPDAFIQFIQLANPGGEVATEAAFLLQNNFNLGLNLETMIFDGSYFVALQAAKSYRTYVQKDLEVQKRDISKQVIETYLPLLLLQENIGILDKNIANLNRLLYETQELYKAGFVEQLDIDRQSLSLTNLKTDRENLLRQKNNALNALKVVLGYPIDEPLKVDGDLKTMATSIDENDLLNPIDFSRRPEIGLIDQGLELNELNKKNFKSLYLPSLRGNAAYTHIYQGNDLRNGFWAPQSYVGATINIPIFDGLDKKAKIQRTNIEIEKTRNQKIDAIRGIELEVINARNSYLNASKNLEAQQNNQALAERIYNTTQIKYKEGVGSSLEVTQAEQGLYAAQSNYLQALYEVIKAKKDLEIALGQ